MSASSTWCRTTTSRTGSRGAQGKAEMINGPFLYPAGEIHLLSARVNMNISSLITSTRLDASGNYRLRRRTVTNLMANRSSGIDIKASVMKQDTNSVEKNIQ